MNLAEFRKQVLATLQSAKALWSQAKVFLFYAPGYDDPLGLAASDATARRETALVRWAVGAGYEKVHFPRVIEFDCRRVAAYLLENDAALDDPLLEETITRAHADLHAAAPEPDNDEGTGRAICGWLVSADDAATIARRFSSSSHRSESADQRRRWLRWHDPRTMAVLWPSMSNDQKAALLGEQLVWLAVDAAGHLVRFEAPPPSAAASEKPEDPFEGFLATPSMNVTKPQWETMHCVGLVNHLVEVWRERENEPLPHHATETIHRLIEQANGWGLDGRDLQTYVMTALDLQGDFQSEPGLVAALREAAQSPGTLGDHLTELPDEFWERYGRRR